MRKIGQHPLQSTPFIGLAVLSTILAAIVIVLRHLIDTPQSLESMLPGEAHLFRWHHGHIFYKTIGDKSTPPLVLLHAPGMTASSYEMRKISSLLAQHYFIYTPDLLGFGLSDRPHLEYSAEMYIALCHDFLTNVVGQPATIVASGLSGNYAIMIAKRYPQCCSNLILLSPLDLVSNRNKTQLWSSVLAIPTGGLFLYAFLSTRPMLRLRHFLSTQQHITRAELDYLYATTHRFGAEHAPMALLKGALTVDTAKAFATLPQPALAIWGVKALNALRFLTNSYALPDTIEIIIIQDAGESVHEERPTIVAAHIREWLQTALTEQTTGT